MSLSAWIRMRCNEAAWGEENNAPGYLVDLPVEIKDKPTETHARITNVTTHFRPDPKPGGKKK